jgi:hypothetical protein
VVEKLELGGGGFACVLDDEGLVLCHPDIRGEPGLRSVNPAPSTRRFRSGPGRCCWRTPPGWCAASGPR